MAKRGRSRSPSTKRKRQRGSNNFLRRAGGFAKKAAGYASGYAGTAGKIGARALIKTVMNRVSKPTMMNEDLAGGRFSYIKINNTHGGIRLKGGKFFGSVSTLQMNSTTNLAVATGQQGWMDMEFCNYAQLALVAQQAETQVLSAINETGHVINLTGPNTTNPYLISATMECFFTNASVHSVCIEMYDYKYRKDSNDGVAQMVSKSFDAGGQLQATNVIALSPNTPGYTLTDNSYACSKVKILKRSKFWLAPGETRAHKIFVKFNKCFDYQAYLAAEASLPGYADNIKDWTVGCAIRVHTGCSAGSATGQDVGKCDIRAYHISRFKSRPILGISRNHVDQMKVNITGIPGGTERFISELAGQILTEGVGTLTNTLLA